jgi:hypothetical protein
MSRTLSAKRGSFESLSCRIRCGCRPWLRQMRCTELTLTPLASAMAGAVQCVVSPGGSVSVNRTARAMTSASNGGIRGGRVLSRSRPSTPACMNLSCQRQTAALATPAWRMICAVPCRAVAIGRQQHDSRAPDMLLRAVAVADNGKQALAVAGSSMQADPSAQGGDPHAAPDLGNPFRPLPSGFIH